MSETLHTLRVLIVEDEFYLADDLAAALRRAGSEVVGPVGTLREAEEIVGRERLDCAILDMNLRGEMAFPLADWLETEGIPFVVASGYTSGAIPERFSRVPRIEKPFAPREVIAMIPGLLGKSG